MYQRSITVQILSEMSEEECVEFIVKNGVVIPQQYADLPNLGANIKRVIKSVETYHDYPITFNNRVLRDFIKNIITVVNDYYGVIRGTSYPHTSRDDPYYLNTIW